MRNFGILAMIIGLGWGVFAFTMKTTVETGGREIFDGLSMVYVPRSEVHNLDLADKRRNHLMGACATFLSGVLLLGFGSFQNKKEHSPKSTNSIQERKCPFCAETIKSEATVCRFCSREVEPLKSDEWGICSRCKHLERNAFDKTKCSLSKQKVALNHHCEKWEFC